jgi:cardiolipin synthase C
VRWMELALSAPRLNHRMHNKLFIVDNSLAIAGGRNLGDPYFESGKDLQFGDYDVVALGPAVRALSHSFDAYWNSALAVTVEGLFGAAPAASALPDFERDLALHRTEMRGSDLERRSASGQPFKSLLAGTGSLVWANAEVIYDSPDKADVESGYAPGTLMRRKLIEASKDANSELIVVSPYFVPGEPGVRMLTSLRQRGVRVRVLTNSLASTDEPIVHSGYQRYRVPLLEEGVEISEVKPLPGKPQAGSELKNASGGQFALHAKVFVIDRKRIFIGSANFDRRSFHLNTEVGLLIDSPELARQVVERFDAIAQPANSYVLSLAAEPGALKRLTWRSEDDGRAVETTVEPGNDRVRELKVDLLSLLPLDELL